MPRYYKIKNLLLVASVSDDWYKAEGCRRAAEHIWNVAHTMTRGDEAAAVEALRELRGCLDDLKVELDDQRPEDFDEYFVYENLSGEGYKEGKFELEDTEAVHEAEERVWGSRADMARYFEEAGATGKSARQARERAVRGAEAQRMKGESERERMWKQPKKTTVTKQRTMPSPTDQLRMDGWKDFACS